MLADLRTAVRALRRAPGFVVAAVVTLALGIGATTAIFSVVDAMLLRPLPYAHAQQLVTLWSHQGDARAEGPPSYPDFTDWRDALTGAGRPFAGLAIARSEGLLLRGSESAASVNIAVVSDGFFGVLGGRPLLGRTFTAAEERADAPRVIVLGHRLWRTRFGGDPRVVGRTLDFAQGSFTVVGVMPPGYEYPGRWAEAWAPLAPWAATNPALRQRLTRRDLRVDSRVIGRLAPGVGEAAGQGALAAVASRLAADHPAENRRVGAHLVGLRAQMTGTVRQPLLVLAGAVGLLLLVACADVANLTLVRASARERELAVRGALGAGPRRVVRQLLAESVVVAIAGGALGVLLAVGGVAALVRLAPDTGLAGAAPRLDGAAVDGRVLVFALAAALGTALLFGLAPALQAVRGASPLALREGTRAVAGGAAGRRFRDVVTVVQIALTLVLLVGGGLLARSFIALRARTAGFPIERLAVVRVDPLATRYATPEQLVALYERLRASAAAIPGARGASVVNHLAMTGAGVPTEVRVPNGPDSLSATYRVADGTFFGTTGIRVRRGRALDDDDVRRATAPNAVDVPVVVSAELARQAFPRGDALGQRLTVFKQASGRADYGQPVAALVVGVSDDVKFGSLDEPVPDPTVYLPVTVNPWRWGYLVVRAAGDPAALVAPLRAAVRAVDPDIPVTDVRTGSDVVAASLGDRRFDLALVLSFALAALTLAAVGVYGVVAQGTALRGGELGVRAVLGAAPGQLVRLVLGAGARLTALGIGAGLALSAAATRLLEGMLVGIGTRDAATYAIVSGALALVALAASAIPARRAARTDPATVIRGQ
ncbi:MAG: ABC transporter permease [Gemmatirosa sp.]|nr:ABC transporter permease [Gemmatirosa sp.]